MGLGSTAAQLKRGDMRDLVAEDFFENLRWRF